MARACLCRRIPGGQGQQEQEFVDSIRVEMLPRVNRVRMTSGPSTANSWLGGPSIEWPTTLSQRFEIIGSDRTGSRTENPYVHRGCSGFQRKAPLHDLSDFIPPLMLTIRTRS